MKGDSDVFLAQLHLASRIAGKRKGDKDVSIGFGRPSSADKVIRASGQH